MRHNDKIINPKLPSPNAPPINEEFEITFATTMNLDTDGDSSHTVSISHNEHIAAISPALLSTSTPSSRFGDHDFNSFLSINEFGFRKTQEEKDALKVQYDVNALRAQNAKPIHPTSHIQLKMQYVQEEQKISSIIR